MYVYYKTYKIHICNAFNVSNDYDTNISELCQLCRISDT